MITFAKWLLIAAKLHNYQLSIINYQLSTINYQLDKKPATAGFFILRATTRDLSYLLPYEAETARYYRH